ncbi:MAG: vancomycin resistance histidine kinase VanS [Angelakisella sp.]|nr:vancomycin resistance histidine kinase VanS [Angelakisella sp.]
MIFLPAPLREAQDHLNLLRERSLRAAAVAKEAEQRKNDLIVYLAHDLKTPLTSVIGYLTLLRDEEEISPRLREKYTGIALDKALRLEDLVNEFFDITRFNLTTLTLEPERTNLSRMLEQMVSEFSPVLQEKELSWETAISQDVEISCDRDKLQRVLDNLIRNAVSYSAPGTAILVAMEPEGNEAVLRLQNHGRTIPPEKLCHIFEQFYRVDSSRASATGGAGLGLAIAKEIVELHGGSITAKSEQESVLFTVRLPKGL